MPGSDHEEPLAGEGCPLVAEFCIAELGAVLGISTTSAKKLIGHALELRHRLPRLWAQVQAGRVPAWRARTVAETTIHTTPALTVEAAAWVDAQVAAVAGRIGPAQLDRLVAETIKRYDLAAADPAADPEDGYLSVDPRHATCTTRTSTSPAPCASRPSSTSPTPSTSTAPWPRRLPSRRPWAPPSPSTYDAPRRSATSPAPRPRWTSPGAGAGRHRRTDLPVAREVVLHAHFDATTVGEQTVFGPTGRMEEGQRLILLDQVRSWCGDSRTKVTIKPVIDLNAQLSAPGYAIPDRIREQVILRDRTCVFPWCTRPARGCDIDHVIAYDHDAEAEGRPQPGPTTTSNLAALCRFHHRLKTHTAWRYRVTGPAASSGPAPTATATDATPPAPRASRAAGPTSDPAPHPAEPRSGGAQACPASRGDHMHPGQASRRSSASRSSRHRFRSSRDSRS